TTRVTAPARPAARRPRPRLVWAALAAVAVVGVAAVASLAIVLWGPWPATTPTSPESSARPSPAQLSPPDSPRTDFALDVVMVDTQGGTDDPVVLRPENGIIQLRPGQQLKFRVKVGKPAYVGVWSVNADGPAVQMFPNKLEGNHHFAQGEERL